MNFFQTLLYPTSLLYSGVTSVRNLLYDKELLHSEGFDVPVLVVGNLTVGGTGKTPHTEYLIRLLKPHKRVAVLSRGYKRSTKGFRIAQQADTADTLGDEPMLYHTLFPDITVAVGEDRPAAIKKLLQQKPAPEVILLDDALQHRPLRPSFRLLLTDCGRLFYKDQVLPAGLLRESKSGAERADAVVVTKCPDELTEEQKAEIIKDISRYTKPATPVFFTAYAYGAPVPLQHSQSFRKKMVLLTGIANPKPLREYLEKQGYEIVQQLTYPDHYHYRESDLQQLQEKLNKLADKEVSVVTTSKDSIKLQPLLDGYSQLPLFYIPVQVAFTGAGEEAFRKLILKAAQVSD